MPFVSRIIRSPRLARVPAADALRCIPFPCETLIICEACREWKRRCGCPTRRVYVWDSCGDEFGCGCWVPRTSGLRAVCVPNDAAGRVGLLILLSPVLHYPTGSIGMGAPHVGFTCGAFALVVPRSSLPNRIDWHGCPTRRVYVWGFCSCCSPFFITQPDRLAWVPHTSGLRVGLLLLLFPVLHYPTGSIGMGAPHVGFTCGAFALVVPRSSLPNRIDWHGCPTRRVYVWGFCSCCSPFFITQPDRLGLTRLLPSHRTTNCSMANPWDDPPVFS